MPGAGQAAASEVASLLESVGGDVQQLLLPRPAGIANYFLPRFPQLFWTLYALVEEHWPNRQVFEPFFAWRSSNRSSQRTAAAAAVLLMPPAELETFQKGR